MSFSGEVFVCAEVRTKTGEKVVTLSLNIG
jgi:hypothetical protein